MLNLHAASFYSFRMSFSPGILANATRPVQLKPVELENSMNDDTGRDIAVFTEAIRVPLQNRASFLDKACGGDDDLRRKVEALLSAHDRIGSFLEEPPTEEPVE